MCGKWVLRYDTFKTCWMVARVSRKGDQGAGDFVRTAVIVDTRLTIDFTTSYMACTARPESERVEACRANGTSA